MRRSHAAERRLACVFKQGPGPGGRCVARRDGRGGGATPRAGGRTPPGSTLAEILVALLLIGVAVMSLGGAASSSAALLRGAALEQGAVLAADAVLDSLAAAPDVQPGERVGGPFTLVWTVADSAATRLIQLDVRYTDGGTPRRLDFGLRSARSPEYAPEPF